MNPRRYTWSDSIKQEAISAIVDVAHELARRYLTEGDAANAGRTATIGLRADPAAEILWRDLLRAEYLTGNRTSIEHIADRLTSRLEELDCEMEPATIDLLDELLNSNRTPALSSAN